MEYGVSDITNNAQLLILPLVIYTVIIIRQYSFQINNLLLFHSICGG